MGDEGGGGGSLNVSVASQKWPYIESALWYLIGQSSLVLTVPPPLTME